MNSLVHLQVPLKTPKDIVVAFSNFTKIFQIAATEAYTDRTLPQLAIEHGTLPFHIEQILHTKKAYKRLGNNKILATQKELQCCNQGAPRFYTSGRIIYSGHPGRLFMEKD